MEMVKDESSPGADQKPPWPYLLFWNGEKRRDTYYGLLEITGRGEANSNKKKKQPEQSVFSSRRSSRRDKSVGVNESEMNPNLQELVSRHFGHVSTRRGKGVIRLTIR